MFVRGIMKSRIDGDGNIIDEYLADKWISPMHPEVVKDGPGKCDVCGMDLVPAASLGYVGDKLDRKDAPLLIPASAPLITGKRAVAYVELPNDKGPLFEGREIVLGPRAGDFYVVRSGLEEGELVVSNGAFKIDSELQIQAKPSMMSPTGGVVTTGHQHDANSPPRRTSHDEATVERSNESTEAREGLIPVYNRYFDIQIALAKDDANAAMKAGEGLSAALESVDMSVFSRSGHKHWMELSRSMLEQADRIATATDIELARDAFFHLSQATIELHKRFGHSGKASYFLAHCPMTRDANGAYWLQTEDIVWNSFYGASMLRCGSIKDTLAPMSEGKTE
jgi:Cu(I)/Ag(I) efflux system membrane fusion protein